MNPQEYLDNHVIDDIDFDKYLHSDEVAKIKPAGRYSDHVKELFLLGDQQQGLRLPWQKADGFRFREGELTIWTGYNGHKKSMMQGFVMLGLMAQGGKGLIASLEMQPKKTLWRMCKQFVGNSEPTMPYIEKYFDWLNGKLWLYDQVGTVKPDRMIAVARYAVQELGVTQVVIDSLMKCGISGDDYNRQKSFVDELCAVAKDTGAHIHLVAHSKKPQEGKESVPSSKYGVSGSAAITDMADNVIISYSNKAEDRKFDQMLICEKQRNGEEEPKYFLTFDERSLQFKGYSSAPTLTVEDWERCAWK
tara:strand:+ start:95 stop:1009 length:915 start_codon:yes stop_codon:yes gene_type:complete